jgi:hypothetical protein
MLSDVILYTSADCEKALQGPLQQANVKTREGRTSSKQSWRIRWSDSTSLARRDCAVWEHEFSSCLFRDKT